MRIFQVLRKIYFRNGSCSNCNMKNSPQTAMEARNGNLVNCDNCSFYLYDPEA